MNTAKKHTGKKPQMKAKTSHAGGGAMKMAHGPKTKMHPAKGGAVKAKPKKAAGMTSSVKGKSQIPVKGAKAHKGGKKADSKQENPFGKGEVIKFGFK